MLINAVRQLRKKAKSAAITRRALISNVAA
jgi:hypothetical protein